MEVQLGASSATTTPTSIQLHDNRAFYIFTALASLHFGEMAGLDTASSSQDLYKRLAKKLPASHKFTFHHFSTPPTKCDPLFAPAPGRKPERTFCESHFLTISALKGSRLVLLFAIEVLIFTTKRLTTVFVSKADSTGCLASLKVPKGAGSSTIQIVASEFVSWLVENRQRPRTRLVLSLFARAQGQYLFPASVDNKSKHVLDDRQLVRWWCKTLDPVLRRPLTSTSSKAHVIVPGFDRQETTAFFPSSHRLDPVDGRKWAFGHPLEEIAANPAAPPRCLVPRFPDDPKARYLDELDDELPDASGPRHISSPSKKGNGFWKSIKTLAQFWEMMAFRQECSSGRMVGFIWVVFTPDDIDTVEDEDPEATLSALQSSPPDTQSLPSISDVLQGEDDASAEKRSQPKKPLTGLVIPRQPRVKRASSSLSSTSLAEHSLFWRWEESSRGQIVVSPQTYDSIHDVLLKLDFSSDEAAVESTTKWLEEAATLVGEAAQWGKEVVGEAAVQVANTNSSVPSQGPVASQRFVLTHHVTHGILLTHCSQPNDLSASIVRKKRKLETPVETPQEAAPPAVNMLSSGLIRKKPKVA